MSNASDLVGDEEVDLFIFFFNELLQTISQQDSVSSNLANFDLLFQVIHFLYLLFPFSFLYRLTMIPRFS